MLNDCATAMTSCAPCSCARKSQRRAEKRRAVAASSPSGRASVRPVATPTAIAAAPTTSTAMIA